MIVQPSPLVPGGSADFEATGAALEGGPLPGFCATSLSGPCAGAFLGLAGSGRLVPGNVVVGDRDKLLLAVWVGLAVNPAAVALRVARPAYDAAALRRWAAARSIDDDLISVAASVYAAAAGPNPDPAVLLRIGCVLRNVGAKFMIDRPSAVAKYAGFLPRGTVCAFPRRTGLRAWCRARGWTALPL